jgi:hypothetical protein
LKVSLQLADITASVSTEGVSIVTDLSRLDDSITTDCCAAIGSIIMVSATAIYTKCPCGGRVSTDGTVGDGRAVCLANRGCDGGIIDIHVGAVVAGGYIHTDITVGHAWGAYTWVGEGVSA